MKKPALRRATKSTLLLVIASLLFLAGMAGTTFAFFDGETDNPATVAGGWVDLPTALGTPTELGFDETLGWTHGTHDVTGQEIWDVNNGTTANCTGVIYTGPVTTAPAAANTVTVTSVGTSATSGTWECFQVRSTHGTWYQPANFAATRLGVWFTSGSLANNNNSIARNDVITLNFSEAVTLTAPQVISCLTSPRKVLIGANSCGASPTVGTLTLSGGSRTFTTSATWNTSVAGSGTTQLRITLSTNTTVGISGTGTASWAFQPSGTAIQSVAGTNHSTVCTSPICGATTLTSNF